MANLNRGRLSVTLGNSTERAHGLETLGTVTRKGKTHALGVDQWGAYFAFGQSVKPELLPAAKVQAALAAAHTGIANPSQAERMRQSPKTAHGAPESDSK